MYTLDIHAALALALTNTISDETTTRELRNRLSDVLGQAKYGGERIGATRNGKPAAVIVSVDDFHALETLRALRGSW